MKANNLNKTTLVNDLYKVTSTCLIIYILSRLIIAFEYASINHILNNSQSLIENLWKWDSGIYGGIATNGYPITTIPDKDSWPWFPVWPIILRIFSLNLFFPIKYTGLILNQIFFFGDMILLWLFLNKLKLNRDDIVFTIIILAVSPANIYFCAGLTESLFLFLSLGVFYCLHAGKYKTMLLFGCLISGTRMTGEVLIVPVLYHLYKTRNLSIKKCLIYIPIMSGGLICYMLYGLITIGDPIMFIHAEATRNRGNLGVLEVLENTPQIFARATIYDLTIFLFSLFVITIILLKSNLVKEAIYNVLSVLPGYISGILWNSFRFDTGIFPFYLGLTMIAKTSYIRKYLITLSN